jgi:hypothetical protein
MPMPDFDEKRRQVIIPEPVCSPYLLNDSDAFFHMGFEDEVGE